MRKLACLALCLAATLLPGCWSYKSLSDIAIVMGMTIDHDPGGKYRVTAEIVDLSGSIKDSGPKIQAG